MVPSRLTRKSFRNIYLYHDPILWKAYIDAVKYFNIDWGLILFTGDQCGRVTHDENIFAMVETARNYGKY